MWRIRNCSSSTTLAGSCIDRSCADVRAVVRGFQRNASSCSRAIPRRQDRRNRRKHSWTVPQMSQRPSSVSVTSPRRSVHGPTAGASRPVRSAKSRLTSIPHAPAAARGAGAARNPVDVGAESDTLAAPVRDAGDHTPRRYMIPGLTGSLLSHDALRRTRRGDGVLGRGQTRSGR